MLIKPAKLESEGEIKNVVSRLGAIAGILISLIPLVLVGWVEGDKLIEPLGLTKQQLLYYSGIAATLGIAFSILLYAVRSKFAEPASIFKNWIDKQSKAVAALLLLLSMSAIFLVPIVEGGWKGLLYVVAMLFFVGCIEIVILIEAIERDSVREDNLKWEALNQSIMSNFLVVENIQTKENKTNEVDEFKVRVLKDKGTYTVRIKDSVSNPHINYEVDKHE